MLKAIIFDFDGVISNSEPTHFATFQRVLAEEGIKITETDYFQRYLAMDDKGAFSAAFRDAGVAIEPVDIARLIARKAGYFDELSREMVTVYPDAIEFIRTIAARLPLAINSGALRAEIDHVLKQTALAEYFSLIVSAEDITNCKPDPEGYLTALSRLNDKYPDLLAAPANCLVIEDSIGGIKSALAAGMRVVAVTNTYPATALTEASVIVASLAELTEELLLQLFPHH